MLPARPAGWQYLISLLQLGGKNEKLWKIFFCIQKQEKLWVMLDNRETKAS